MIGVLDRLRADPRVMFVDDERSLGNSVIVTLHNGWRFDAPGVHVFGEDTPTAALATLRKTKPCSCAECAAATESTPTAMTAKPGEATMKKRKTTKATRSTRRAAKSRKASTPRRSTRKASRPAPRKVALATLEAALKPARRTRADELADFLRCDGGRSIDAVCAEFGWLPHSARAAISRLGSDKRLTVDTTKGDNGTIYAIKAAA